ncbi:hypothetical protein ZWY2020_001854 [Hordeum vulgare]|nr:hypothetical protein ZWY2020_001854 [Hordeum vulgare]
MAPPRRHRASTIASEGHRPNAFSQDSAALVAASAPNTRPGRASLQAAASTPTGEPLGAEVERKMVLAKAAGGERPSSSSAPVAAEEQQQRVMEQRVLAVPGNLPPVSSKAEKFPARSGFGTIGRRCRVRANHCRNNNTRKSEAQMKTNQKKK